MVSSLSATLSLSRIVVLNRLLVRPCSTFQDGKQKLRSVSIGGLTKPIKEPKNPELVPTKYLPKDDEIPKETLRVIIILWSKIHIFLCVQYDSANIFFIFKVLYLLKFLTVNANHGVLNYS